MMRVTDSPLTAGLSTTTVDPEPHHVILSFVLVMVRSLFAKWLYRKSAASTSGASAASSRTRYSAVPC